MRLFLFGLAGILFFGISDLKAEETAINVAIAEYGANLKQSTSSCSDLSMNSYSAKPVWNSKRSNSPQWIIVDLGTVRNIFKIVIKHDAAERMTSDFQVQGGFDANGPWRDLVPPIANNKDHVSTHEFVPTDIRYIRLFITKPSQPEAIETTVVWLGLSAAHILEIQAFTKREFLKEPILSIKSIAENYDSNGIKEDVAVSLIMPETHKNFSCEFSSQGKPLAKFTDWDGSERTLTLTTTEYPIEIQADISDGAQHQTIKRLFTGSQLGYFRNGTVYVFSSSHQDTAWMDEPNACIQYRDEKVITPALELMKKNPNYTYDIETAMSLMEYLDRHPERREEIANFNRQSRLSWGATYTHPYESSYGSESLVRSTYLGRKWIKTNLSGCDSIVAWNLDVPGRSLQMPQILAKAGIKYLLFSRFTPGLYRWYGPDGSSVLGYSTGGYPIQKVIMATDDIKSVEVNLRNSFYYWAPYYASHKIPPVYGLLYSDDFGIPKDFDNIMNPWNLKCNELQMPKIEYATAEKFFRSVDVNDAKFDVLKGERPGLWLYEMPGHSEAMLKAREAGRVLPAAETFAAISTMLSGNFGTYPQAEFEGAWKNAIYADHGWGGNGQEVTDRLCYEKFASAARTGRQILNKNLNEIASQVATKSDCTPVVVFNQLSWPRTDVVVSEFYSSDKSFYEWQLEDEQGGKVEWQVIPGNLNKDSIGFTFIAKQVPSFGYRVYYLKHIKSNVAWNEDGDQKREFVPRDAASSSFENKYYSAEFASGGIKKLFDKELQANIIKDNSNFLFGELFTIKSAGFGCGEQDEIQPVSLDGFEKISSYHPAWSCNEDGPVKTVYESTQKMKNCTVVQRVTFYSEIKRIDFEVSLLGWDGAKYREFRLAFPVSGSSNKVLYEVPMGIVEVGKDEIKNSGSYGACKDVHPREVQDWFATYNENSALTISSDASVFDWVDPVQQQDTNDKVLQPVLLSSRRSCHPSGSWYAQTGDHNYSCSIFSHKPDKVESMRSAKSAALPMIAVVDPKRNPDAKLPEVLSFCEINNTNATISAFKKCEDDNSYIFRCYDFEGVSSSGRINLFRPIKTLWKTNMIEEVGQNPMIQNDIKIDPFAIETYKINIE